MFSSTEARVLLCAATLLVQQEATARGPDSEASSSSTTAHLPARAVSLAEVFVSARKIREDAQRVPMSISTLSGERLEAANASRIQDIIEGVPNVSMELLTPRQSSLAIRGLGKSPANDGLEASVGVFLDGVYLGRPSMMTSDLVDLERVEILRGPQGTLFGKNVTAGALSIATRGPDDIAQGYVQATIGTAEWREIKAALSGPIGASDLGYRMTAFAAQREGFVDAVVTGEKLGDLDRKGLRAQLQWDAAGRARWRAIADYSAQEESGPALVLVDPGLRMEDGSIRSNNFLDRTMRAGFTPEFEPFARRAYSDSPNSLKSEQAGLSLQGDWSWGRHSLTSISAWRGGDFEPHTDGDLTPLRVQPDLGFGVSHRQLSQEIRIASGASSKLQYVLGAYLFGQRITGTFVSLYGPDAADFAVRGLSPAVLDGFRVQTIGTPKTESYAAFGQGTWHVTPRVEITAGLRWTREHKRADIERTSSGGAPLADTDTVAQALRTQLGGASQSHVSLSEGFLSALASASYALSEDVLAYASIARGAKSGGINSAVVPSGIEQVLDPEVATSYEIGLKSEGWSGRVRTNLALYRTLIEDYQATVRDPVRAATFIANAGAVRSQGIELETTLLPTPELQVGFAWGWVDSTFTSFRNATCPTETIGRSVCDVTGARVPGAPPWTLSGSAAYESAIFAGAAKLYVAADVVHSASYRVDLSRFTQIDAHALVNARVGIRSPHGRWDLWLWSRNVLDEEYFTFLSSAGLFNAGAVYGVVGDPRTFGVSLRIAY